MRLFLGALAGAVIVFIASAILHMAGPLGRMGITTLPNEDATLEAIRATIPKSGIYLFPGISKAPTDAETKAWEAKVRQGPYGLLVVTREGFESMFAQQLGMEFVTVLLAALIAAYIVSLTNASYGARVLIVAMLALFTFLSVTASHWIWYKFPTPFVVAELLMELIAWTLGGLAIAKIVRPRAA